MVRPKYNPKLETRVKKRVKAIHDSDIKRFNMAEQVVIMNLLKTNKNDYVMTANMIGVPVDYLKRWVLKDVKGKLEDHAILVIDRLIRDIDLKNRGELPVLLPKVSGDVSVFDANSDTIVRQAQLVRQKAFTRLLEILPYEQRVENILSAIKEMNVIIKDETTDLINSNSGGGIVSALQKLSANPHHNQDDMLAELIGKVDKNQFIQINLNTPTSNTDADGKQN